MVEIKWIKYTGRGKDMKVTVELPLLLLHRILDKSGIRKEMIDEKDGMPYDFMYPSEVEACRKLDARIKKDPDYLKKQKTFEQYNLERMNRTRGKNKKK